MRGTAMREGSGRNAIYPVAELNAQACGGLACRNRLSAIVAHADVIPYSTGVT